MKDHLDIAERKRWNAFKKAYRKSHPTQIRKNQYHTHVRTIYRDQDKPNLEPWICNCHHERQNQRVAETEQYLEYLMQDPTCNAKLLAYVRTQIEILKQA